MTAVPERGTPGANAPSPETWIEVRQALEQALLATPERRQSLLDALDPYVRAHVQALLAHDTAGTPTPTPTAGANEPAPASELLALGTDRFEVRRKLGAGASGDVYEAYDRREDAVVAIKALRQLDPGAIYRFKRGFRALKKLRHPNLVKLYELIANGASLFLTMELLEGVDFLRHVRAERCDLARLRAALSQLATGVAALHRAGVLHRDIKPSNVFVTPEGRVVLLDFGLARELQLASDLGSITLAGTPHYMAPELLGGSPASESSDWYSVGVVVFQALTARLPFEGDVLDALVRKRQDDPVAPSRLVADVPADLDELCLTLLSREPARRPSGSEVLLRLDAPATPGGRTPSEPQVESPSLIGRTAQLRQLEDALQAVEGGRAVTLHVRGHSGVGKTSLVRHFLEHLHARRPDAVVLSGRCHSSEAVPYKAMDEVVDGLAAYLAVLPAAELDAVLPRSASLLGRLFPVLRQIDRTQRKPNVEQPTDSLELRRRSFAALRELLGRIADRRPLVVFIDDVQWGDLDSAAFLAELAAPPDMPALLLIIAYRTEDEASSAFLADLAARQGEAPGAERRVVDVGGLADADAEDLALRLLAHVADRQRETFALAIARESHGNPFFIQQLTRYAGTREVPASPPTVRLETVIAERVARLPAPARDLLELVAVAGRPLDWTVAREAAALGGHSHEARERLVGEYLARARGAEGAEEIEVYHDLVREAIVRALPAHQLRSHHASLARVLERSFPADHERLLGHSLGAGDGPRAGEHAAMAARAAASALAFDRAASLYRLTLQLARHDDVEQARLRRELGDALANAGRGREAAHAYLEAAAGLQSDDRFEVRRKAADQLLRSGHLGEGAILLRELCAELRLWFPKRPWQVLLAAALARVAVRLSGLRFSEKDPGAISAATLRQLDLCWTAGFGLSFVDPLRGSYFESRFLLLASRTGDLFRFAMALAGEVASGTLAGGSTRRRAERLYTRLVELVERLQDPRVRAFSMSMRGTMAWVLGDWRTALEMNQNAVELFRATSTGFGWEQSTARIIEFSALAMLGEWRPLAQRLPPALKEARERGDLYASVGLRLMPYTYLVRLAADEPDRARDEILAALGEWPTEGYHVQHSDALFGLVDVELYRGEGREALRLITAQWSSLVRSQLLYTQLTRIFAHALRARAALASVAAGASGGERAGLLGRARRDTDRIARERMEWSQGWVDLLRAGHAAELGERCAALEWLERAEPALKQACMPQFLAAARRRRGALVGGPAGSRLIAEAELWMRSQGVRNPERMTAMLAPGGWTRLAGASEGGESTTQPRF